MGAETTIRRAVEELFEVACIVTYSGVDVYPVGTFGPFIYWDDRMVAWRDSPAFRIITDCLSRMCLLDPQEFSGAHGVWIIPEITADRNPSPTVFSVSRTKDTMPVLNVAIVEQQDDDSFFYTWGSDNFPHLNSGEILPTPNEENSHPFNNPDACLSLAMYLLGIIHAVYADYQNLLTDGF